MKIKSYLAILLIASLGLVVTLSARADVPRVVVSIKPIYSLIGAVMAGAGDGPGLIVGGSASPHGFALRPSDALKLSHADIVFWIGPGLERFLTRPLATLSGKARIIELAASHFMKILPRGVTDTRFADNHIWLDVRNARAIIAIAVAELSALDVANSGLYRDNGERLSADLDNLDLELKLKLAPVVNKPFIVSHDAYGYLVDAYNLNMAGYVTDKSGRMPGARRLRKLRHLVINQKISCLFRQPFADTSIVAMLGEGVDLETPVLDSLGSSLTDRPEMYFSMMREIADTLVQCLGR